MATEGTQGPLHLLHPLRLTFLSILIQSHYLMISSLIPLPHHVIDLSWKWIHLWENSFRLVQRIMLNKCSLSPRSLVHRSPSATVLATGSRWLRLPSQYLSNLLFLVQVLHHHLLLPLLRLYLHHSKHLSC